MKVLIVFAFVGILAALASAGAYMLRHGRHAERAARQGTTEVEQPHEPDRKMARALAIRVGLSVALFLFVLLSWFMGWVRPGGLPIGG
jgi:hypothetical protein